MPTAGKRSRGRPARDQESVTVRLDADAVALLVRLKAALEVAHGKLSQGDVVAAALHALERELTNPPKRKGPRAVVV